MFTSTITILADFLAEDIGESVEGGNFLILSNTDDGGVVYYYAAVSGIKLAKYTLGMRDENYFIHYCVYTKGYHQTVTVTVSPSIEVYFEILFYLFC